MTVLIIEHQEQVPLGLLHRDDVPMRIVRPYRGDPLPDSFTDVSGLVVLGGQMGANDDAEYPWLSPVKELIREAAREEVPTLLLCLGHQLGAVALGGVVETSPLGPQWGVRDVGLTEAGRSDPLLSLLPAGARTVHWNDDLVTRLPEGAVVLAHDPRGGVQAARFAPAMWGVQCHPEAGPSIVAMWAAARADRPAPLPEQATRGLAEVEAEAADLDRTWRPVLDAFLALTLTTSR